MFDIHLAIVEHRSFEVPDEKDRLEYDLNDLHAFFRYLGHHSYIALIDGEKYKFDSDLLVVQKICSLENNPKRTLSDFLADSIMDTDDIGR
jgi:hypothetical protein